MFFSVVSQPVKEHTFFAMAIPTEDTGVWGVYHQWRKNAGLNVFANFNAFKVNYGLNIVEIQYADTSVELVDVSFTEIELLEMFLCPCNSILCSVIANLATILCCKYHVCDCSSVPGLLLADTSLSPFLQRGSLSKQQGVKCSSILQLVN